MRTTSTPTKPGPKKFDPSYINTIPWILNGKVINLPVWLDLGKDDLGILNK